VQLDDSRELDGIVTINIVYRVNDQCTVQFCFPYYKSQGTDINIATTVNLLPESG
jgi:hypothetical protein